MSIQISSSTYTGRTPQKPSGLGLTPDEEKVVEKLKAADAEVRAHENAHKSAGGPYVMGGITFRYQTGPDGKRYAVEGEVKIDTSSVSGDPEATIQKARTIRKAANAPANPSAQDRRVASQATSMEMEAMRELAQKRFEKMKNRHTDASSQDTSHSPKKNKQENPVARKYASNSAETEFMNKLLDVYF